MQMMKRLNSGILSLITFFTIINSLNAQSVTKNVQLEFIITESTFNHFIGSQFTWPIELNIPVLGNIARIYRPLVRFESGAAYMDFHFDYETSDPSNPILGDYSFGIDIQYSSSSPEGLLTAVLLDVAGGINTLVQFPTEVRDKYIDELVGKVFQPAPSTISQTVQNTFPNWIDIDIQGITWSFASQLEYLQLAANVTIQGTPPAFTLATRKYNGNYEAQISSNVEVTFDIIIFYNLGGQEIDRDDVNRIISKDGNIIITFELDGDPAFASYYFKLRLNSPTNDYVRTADDQFGNPFPSGASWHYWIWNIKIN